MNLKEIFGTAKPKAVVKKDYGLIASICQELDIRKPHREYDEWDMYIGKDDQVCYCTKEDLVIEDLSNQIWLPIQLNGQTARLQIDDLICTALKTQDPNKVREIYLQWLVVDIEGPAFRYGSDIVLRFEFYRDIVKKRLKNHKK